jgi:phage gp16-like protein
MARELPKIGNREKALIHVAKTKLGLSEEDYRAVLNSVGVTTSKDLNPLQFDEIMSRFESAGFQSSNRNARRNRPPRPVAAKEKLMKKIGAILADTGLPWAYADGMARKMFGLDSVRFCNETELWKVAAALSIYQKRKKK